MPPSTLNTDTSKPGQLCLLWGSWCKYLSESEDRTCILHNDLLMNYQTRLLFLCFPTKVINCSPKVVLLHEGKWLEEAT